MARAGIDQLGELFENLDHLVGTLAAGHDDNYVGIGLLRNRMLEHRLARTERSGDEARTALGQRVESSMARTPVSMTREGRGFSR